MILVVAKELEKQIIPEFAEICTDQRSRFLPLTCTVSDGFLQSGIVLDFQGFHHGEYGSHLFG